jgi:hypothetical protein
LLANVAFDRHSEECGDFADLLIADDESIQKWTTNIASRLENWLAIPLIGTGSSRRLKFLVCEYRGAAQDDARERISRQKSTVTQYTELNVTFNCV